MFIIQGLPLAIISSKLRSAGREQVQNKAGGGRVKCTRSRTLGAAAEREKERRHLGQQVAWTLLLSVAYLRIAGVASQFCVAYLSR